MSGRANDNCSAFTSQPGLLLWAHSLGLHMAGWREVSFTAHITAFNLKSSPHTRWLLCTLYYKAYIKLIATISSVQTKQEGEEHRKRDAGSQHTKTGTVRTRSEHHLRRTHLQQQCLPHGHLTSRAFFLLYECCKPWGMDLVCIYTHTLLSETRNNDYLSHMFQFTFAFLTLELRWLTL